MINKKIHMLNARDNVIMTLIDHEYNLSMNEEINADFEMLIRVLQKKGIDYYKLSKALIPLRDEEKYEYAFIFNSKYFDDKTMFYGEKIINKILSIINKESTQSILIGDYIKLEKMSDNILKEMFIEKIEYVNKCEYVYSAQFFIVYINNITKKQVSNMIEKLKDESYFVGVMNLKYSSRIKQYLSLILCPICIKIKNNVIVSQVSYNDKENYNERGYAYEENGFNLISINEMLYDLFLAYKIPNGIMDKEDLKFSYNILTNIAPEYENLKVIIDDAKWEKYLKREKAEDMKILGLYDKKKEDLEKYILINMYNNYIYNIEENEFGDFKFNVLIENYDNNGLKKNALVSLKYIPNKNEVKLITMF